MFNWRKKIDNHFERLKAKEERPKREKEEQVKREREEKVRKLGQKFRCHICGRPSKEPAKIEHRGEYQQRGTESGYVGGFIVDDWSRPGDLSLCSICEGFTCSEHLHKNICQKCARKL